MTREAALQCAIDRLRAFPALPTAKPGYAEERAEVVKTLEAMLPKRVEPSTSPYTCLGCFHLNAECVCE